jgi:molybdate transport system ATP-binding protein
VTTGAVGAGSRAGEPAVEARFTVEVGANGDRFTLESQLSLARGVLVLFGPSGSGKSLTLQALAGLVRPTRGHIRVHGRTLFDAETSYDVPSHKRAIGYVPQHHSLFPFCDVAENVAFGLPRAQRRRDNPEVRALLDELGLAHLASSRPASLSGGERQRVALARALAVKPRLLLLDEPFASIDQDGRVELRKILRATLERRATPAVFVTHDPSEALALGDSLVRFERGRSTESGEPASLLRRGQPVIVTGELDGPPRPLGEGRAEVTLRAATVDAPAELLERGETSGLRLELRTRPRDPEKKP